VALNRRPEQYWQPQAYALEVCIGLGCLIFGMCLAPLDNQISLELVLTGKII
jgi:hypothetical protein